MIHFKDIKIAPYTELLNKMAGGSVHRGGPVWPDWERRTVVRHRRGRQAVDALPAEVPDQDIAESVDELSAWCGPVCPHFGHMLADFSTRIPVCARMQPMPLLLFCSPPGGRMQRLSDTPVHFREMLAWYRVPDHRVRILWRPTLARRMVCVPQQERLPRTAPSRAYLDLLDANAEAQGLTGLDRQDTVFVSRAGMAQRLAGEAYLERYLARLGVTVMRPETLPLLEQLRVYARARAIVFSEGSALHALQLLGRGLGQVHVLRRRPGTSVAAAALAARCTSIQYHDVGELLCGLNVFGQPAVAHGMTLPSADRLLAALTDAGVAAGDWDEAEFQACARADFRDWWLGERQRPLAQQPGSMERIDEGLKAMGMLPIEHA